MFLSEQGELMVFEFMFQRFYLGSGAYDNCSRLCSIKRVPIKHMSSCSSNLPYG